jgi:hypothetical protein
VCRQLVKHVSRCQQLVKHVSRCQQLVKLRGQLEPLNVRTTCVCSFFFFCCEERLRRGRYSVCVCVCVRARVVQGVEGCELSEWSGSGSGVVCEVTAMCVSL